MKTKTRDDVERREADFHDHLIDRIDPFKVPVIETFTALSCPENRFIVEWLGDVRGLKILDIGCGAGEAAVYFALQGAQVTAVDISPNMIQIAKQVAALHDVSIDFRLMSANSLQFPDGSFDVVYGANVLHHSDLEPTLQNVHRILKVDGRACFWDPLIHNPIINVYRKMAANMRTEDEHPLRMNQLSLFKSVFRSVTWKTYWLTALWVFVHFYLIDRVHPSRQPYWKKIIYESDNLPRSLKLLFRLDSFLLSAMPFLRRYCWNIVVCVSK